jgi:hypothetical protein
MSLGVFTSFLFTNSKPPYTHSFLIIDHNSLQHPGTLLPAFLRLCISNRKTQIEALRIHYYRKHGLHS